MFYDRRSVMIRKPHKCWGCNREFPKGTKMAYDSWVDSTKWFHGYFCSTCVDLINEYCKDYSDFGFCRGDLREEAIERDNWEERKKEKFTWQTSDDNWPYCPACYTRAPINVYEYNRIGVIKPAKTNYCPHCGRRLQHE